MLTSHRKHIKIGAVLVTAVTALVLLPACTVSVKNDKNGGEKQVDIRTPVGGIHVSNDADGRDTGLAIYPGARLKEKSDDGNEKSANVSISSGLFGLKVVAAEYESNDPPEKLISYYRGQLRRYGRVLECHTDQHGDQVNVDHDGNSDSDDLRCEGNKNGKALELKTGTKRNQRMVVIEAQDSGTSFALVRVQIRDSDKDTI